MIEIMGFVNVQFNDYCDAMKIITEMQKPEFLAGNSTFFNILDSSVNLGDIKKVLERGEGALENLGETASILIYKFFKHYNSANKDEMVLYKRELEILMKCLYQPKQDISLISIVCSYILRMVDHVNKAITIFSEKERSSLILNLLLVLDLDYSNVCYPKEYFDIQKQIFEEFKANFFQWHSDTVKEFANSMCFNCRELAYSIESTNNPDNRKLFDFISKEMSKIISQLNFLVLSYIEFGWEDEESRKMLKSFGFSQLSEMTIARDAVTFHITKFYSGVDLTCLRFPG